MKKHTHSSCLVLVMVVESSCKLVEQKMKDKKKHTGGLETQMHLESMFIILGVGNGGVVVEMVVVAIHVVYLL